MQKKVTTFWCSLLLGMLSLTACGFHLRGHENIPTALSKVYIQSQTPYGSFEQVLRDSLRSYNIEVVDTPEQAYTVLNLNNVNLNSVAGSVSSDLNLRQYTLSYVVSYQIVSPQGKVVLPTNSVTSSTTFTSKMSQMMLSSKNSTQQYVPQLQHDAVFRLIMQLLSNNSEQRLNHYMQTQHHENRT